MAARKPRILYVQKPLGGGSVVALYEMIRALDPSRVEPVVLCYEKNEHTSLLLQLGVETIFLREKAAAAVPVGAPATAKKPLKLLAPLRKLKRLVVDDRRQSHRIAGIIRDGRINLIHHNNDINESRQAILANRGFNLPQICHYRSLKPYQNDVVNARIDKMMARRVDYHIYISKAVETHFCGALQIPAVKGTVIRDIIDVQKFVPTPRQQSLADSFGLQPGDMVFANIGRICRWKGQHVFLEAMARLVPTYPFVKALVVGPHETGVGEPRYYQELQQLVQRHQLQQHVIFTGNRLDVPGIISIADVVVHSAVEPEPQGLVIVEALACRKPVIVANAGGAAELVQHGIDGLKVTPGDVAAMCQAMETAISNWQHGITSLQQTPAILSNFNPAEQAAAIHAIYDSLL